MFVPESTLDFHDFGPITPEEARGLLHEFIIIARQTGYKQVLIITGKGNNSGQQPIIKPLVIKELEQNKKVTDFKEAEEFYGGEGALAVNLL